MLHKLSFSNCGRFSEIIEAKYLQPSSPNLLKSPFFFPKILSGFQKKKIQKFEHAARKKPFISVSDEILKKENSQNLLLSNMVSF